MPRVPFDDEAREFLRAGHCLVRIERESIVMFWLC